MTTAPIRSEQFYRQCEKHGLNVPGISIGVAVALASLEHTPIPLPSHRDAHGHGKGPGKRSNLIGRSINAGFAKLDREAGAYVITDKGRLYVAALRNRQLLPTEPSACTP